MPIEPGQTLLHYRIAEKLVECGMGVAWRATDTTLDRNVAIKILPDAFSQEPERPALPGTSQTSSGLRTESLTVACRPTTE